MDKQTPMDTVRQESPFRLTTTPDRNHYSLQQDNGWDWVEVASANGHLESDTTVYVVTVYPHAPVDISGEDVEDALWALTQPEPA
jgi:hypothetical protein